MLGSEPIAQVRFLLLRGSMRKITGRDASILVHLTKFPSDKDRLIGLLTEEARAFYDESNDESKEYLQKIAIEPAKEIQEEELKSFDLDVTYDNINLLRGIDNRIDSVLDLLRSFWVGEHKERQYDVRIGSVEVFLNDDENVCIQFTSRFSWEKYKNIKDMFYNIAKSSITDILKPQPKNPRPPKDITAPKKSRKE